MLFAPFFDRHRVVDGVVLCEGASWPGRLGWNYRAITFGHVILCVDDADARLMAHEMVHVHQYELWGPLFVPAYLLSSVFAVARGRKAHIDNAFEIAARNKSEGPSA